MHDVVRVPQQRVREARLQQVHAQPRRVLDDQVEQDVHGLAVLNLVPLALLGQSQEAAGGQGQELFQSVLDVVVAAEAEEDAEDLIDGEGEAVDIVLMTGQLGLKLIKEKQLYQVISKHACQRSKIRKES